MRRNDYLTVAAGKKSRVVISDFSGGAALVVGSEGKGVGRLIKEKCDVTVSLPMRGNVNSLNASVAASVIMYEIARQRLGL